MSALRKCLIPLLLALLLLVSASSAYSDGPPINLHESVRDETVTWTIAAGQCPSLPAGLSVTGTGERHAESVTKVNSDGSSQIVVNDVVRGDAVDSNGDTYRFIYANHSTTYIPAGGVPVQVDMTDSFVLNGRGAAGNLQVGFKISWTTSDPANEPWPPTNVQIVSMRGEAFACDPI